MPVGAIPGSEQKMLLEIGRWLKVNGEAIYGTRPWRTYGEGPTPVVQGPFADTKRKPFTGEDFRFTTKQGKICAIALAWPESGRLLVKSLTEAAVAHIKKVTLLGQQGDLKWEQTCSGLAATLPGTRPGDYAFTLAVAR